MTEVLCPRCNVKKAVAVREAKSDKGVLLKYFECPACRSLWSNSQDIKELPVDR